MALCLMLWTGHDPRSYMINTTGAQDISALENTHQFQKFGLRKHTSTSSLLTYVCMIFGIMSLQLFLCQCDRTPMTCRWKSTYNRSVATYASVSTIDTVTAAIWGRSIWRSWRSSDLRFRRWCRRGQKTRNDRWSWWTTRSEWSCTLANGCWW